jgi:hypothetical protein
MLISTLPTAITSPGWPPRAITLPWTGEGISTIALSVITSASTPVFDDHVADLDVPGHSSTSAMPSPMSGILMTCVPIQTSMTRFNAAPTRDGLGNTPIPARAGRGVPTGDALDRRFQVVEAVLLHQRHQLGAEAAGAGGFVHHHAAAGFFHRLDDGVQVQRPGCAGR